MRRDGYRGENLKAHCRGLTIGDIVTCSNEDLVESGYAVAWSVGSRTFPSSLLSRRNVGQISSATKRFLKVAERKHLCLTLCKGLGYLGANDLLRRPLRYFSLVLLVYDGT